MGNDIVMLDTSPERANEVKKNSSRKILITSIFLEKMEL